MRSDVSVPGDILPSVLMVWYLSHILIHCGYTDGRGTILRYDNENETVGRHECHTSDGVTEIEFPGMMALRDRFIDEIEAQP